MPLESAQPGQVWLHIQPKVLCIHQSCQTHQNSSCGGQATSHKGGQCPLHPLLCFYYHPWCLSFFYSWWFDPRCCLRTNFAKTILASCALLQIPNIRAHCWSHTLPTLSQTYQQAATFLTLLCSLVVVALQQVAIAWTLASWLTASEAQNLRNVSISQNLHFHMATMDNARACSQYKRYHRAIGSLKPSDAILGVMGAFLQFFQRSVRTIRKRGSISSLTKMLF